MFYVSKNTKYSRATSSPGRKTIVDFESDNGIIIKGLTQDDHYSSIDVIYFEVDNNGVVHRNCINNVSYNRILNTYFLSTAIDDFLPFKDGVVTDVREKDGRKEIEYETWFAQRRKEST